MDKEPWLAFRCPFELQHISTRVFVMVTDLDRLMKMVTNKHGFQRSWHTLYVIYSPQNVSKNKSSAPGVNKSIKNLEIEWIGSTECLFLGQSQCVKSVQIRNFFWSVFSCIWTEYDDLLRKFLYSVQVQKNTDQKKLRIWTLFTQWSLRDFCWFLEGVRGGFFGSWSVLVG